VETVGIFFCLLACARQSKIETEIDRQTTQTFFKEAQTTDRMGISSRI
jgi:hypothetical protein